MKKSWLIIGSILFIVIVLFSWWRSTRNSFVMLDQNIKESIGNLNTAYQRRSDLIPNLVATVEGSVQAERKTLDDVIKARASATQMQLTPEALKDPQAMANFEKVQGQLQGSLSRLLLTVEQYPNLKSQDNFQTLMSQIEGAENRIAVERKNYNEQVKDYNTRILSFPASIIASMSGFKEYQVFQAAAGAENAPKVNFGTEPAQTAPTPDASGAATPPPTNGVAQPK
ncbi:MAG TPA: LemA family protein [Candidatus Kapabacteria bacterium]|nr:LemA family protein [Candidatus Kapabacteria bacterium]